MWSFSAESRVSHTHTHTFINETVILPRSARIKKQSQTLHSQVHHQKGHLGHETTSCSLAKVCAIKDVLKTTGRETDHVMQNPWCSKFYRHIEVAHTRLRCSSCLYIVTYHSAYCPKMHSLDKNCSLLRDSKVSQQIDT